MPDIERVSLIDTTRLSEEFYLQSLITEGYNADILCNSDVEKIQLDCIELLSYKIEQYNSGYSSSIREEAAQSIMSSIVYTIGICLKAYPNADYAATALKETKVSELYSKGRKRIDALLRETKILYLKALKNKINNQNCFYNATLDSGLRKFFKKYKPDLTAQESRILPEYPLSHPVNDLVGIEFARAYIKSIYFENRFCQNFSSEDIHLLLYSYDDSYIDSPINIYQHILKVVMSCIIAKGNIQNLRLTENDLIYLSNTFKDESVDGINKIFYTAFAKTANTLNITNAKYRRYIEASLHALASEIYSAQKTLTLDKLFFTQNKFKIYFNADKRMDNRQYRSVLSKMMQACNINEKIKIIKTQISSLDDLEDTVIDAELSADDIMCIFAELDNTSIAILTKKCSLESNTDFYNLNEQKQFLYDCLCEFIASLSEEKKKMISNIAITLEIN